MTLSSSIATDKSEKTVSVRWRSDRKCIEMGSFVKVKRHKKANIGAMDGPRSFPKITSTEGKLSRETMGWDKLVVMAVVFAWVEVERSFKYGAF